MDSLSRFNKNRISMRVIGIILAFLGGLGLTGWVTGGVFAASLAYFFIPQPSFTKLAVALFELLGHLAKSDGVVDKREIAVVEQIIEMFELDGEDRKKAIECFSRGKAMFDTEALASNLAHHVGDDNDVKSLVIMVLLQVANADGIISEEERRIVETVYAKIPQIGIDLNEVLHSYSDNNPYNILSISPDADLATIKKAYRQKCRELHPDHLQSKKLGPELQAFAEQRLKKVQEAYEHLLSLHQAGNA